MIIPVDGSDLGLTPTIISIKITNPDGSLYEAKLAITSENNQPSVELLAVRPAHSPFSAGKTRLTRLNS